MTASGVREKNLFVKCSSVLDNLSLLQASACAVRKYFFQVLGASEDFGLFWMEIDSPKTAWPPGGGDGSQSAAESVTWNQFTQNTSIHGVKYIFQNSTKTRRSGTLCSMMPSSVIPLFQFVMKQQSGVLFTFGGCDGSFLGRHDWCHDFHHVDVLAQRDYLVSEEKALLQPWLFSLHMS